LIFDSSPSITSTSTSQTRHPCKKEKVVIIIPTHNEAAVIHETIAAVYEVTSLIQGYDVNVLIFDSASTDNTPQVVRDLQLDCPGLYLEQEDQKSGLGSAYFQGMNVALTKFAADIVFEFDADLSHQPKYIPLMLEEIKTCDVVLGSRYVKGGSIPSDWGWHRRFLSVMGNYVARAVLTFKYKDFTSGFRATRAKYLKQVLSKKFLSNHYAYKLHLLWELHRRGAKIREMPIAFIDRTKGESKLPRNSIFDSMRVVLTLRYYEMKRYLKMCLVGVLGVVVQFGVYNLLRLQVPPFNASQIAVLAAIMSNYFLNSRFTFKSNVKIPYLEICKRLVGFVIYSVLMIYFQSYLLILGIEYIGAGTIQENILLAFAIGLNSLLNYLIYSRHIWPECRVEATDSRPSHKANVP
jgi:dolichol-phosphate mannosyltransferase